MANSFSVQVLVYTFKKLMRVKQEVIVEYKECSHLIPLQQHTEDMPPQEWMCTAVPTLPTQTVDDSRFLLEMNITPTLEVTGASHDFLHMTHMLGAFSWDIIMVLLIITTVAPLGIRRATTMMAFTHVNFLTITGTTFMKTLEFMTKTGAVSIQCNTCIVGVILYLYSNLL